MSGPGEAAGSWTPPAGSGDTPAGSGTLPALPRNYELAGKNKVVAVDGVKVKLQIWDTAGQERFRSVTHAYYRDAQALLLLYDITSKMSFDNIRAWLTEIHEYAQKDVVIMLLGNKADVSSERAVRTEDGASLAREYGVPFMETSAKTGMNVELAFLAIAKSTTTSSRRRRNPAAVPSPESSWEEPAAPGAQAGGRQSGGPNLPSSTQGNQALTSQAWMGQYGGVERGRGEPSPRHQDPGGQYLELTVCHWGNNRGVMSASLASEPWRCLHHPSRMQDTAPHLDEGPLERLEGPCVCHG
ncbi:ras-related protein Rab-37 isoform 2-T2 [Spheniscus humboldti]